VAHTQLKNIVIQTLSFKTARASLSEYSGWQLDYRCEEAYPKYTLWHGGGQEVKRLRGQQHHR
uniref:Uncharacterized protein n=1 Tax=Echinococcus canadensis TaxID=519352 RepID=A0A915EV57_9CEST